MYTFQVYFELIVTQIIGSTPAVAIVVISTNIVDFIGPMKSDRWNRNMGLLEPSRDKNAV